MEVQSRCRVQRAEGSGADMEEVQSRCRTGAEVQMCRGGGGGAKVEVKSCWCS